MRPGARALSSARAHRVWSAAEWRGRSEEARRVEAGQPRAFPPPWSCREAAEAAVAWPASERAPQQSKRTARALACDMQAGAHSPHITHERPPDRPVTATGTEPLARLRPG